MKSFLNNFAAEFKKLIFATSVIFIIILLTSCDLIHYKIFFNNKSVYKIFINCDVTTPSSFTLDPGTSQWVDTSINDIFKINIKYNDNDFVSVSVKEDGKGYFASRVGEITFNNK